MQLRLPIAPAGRLPGRAPPMLGEHSREILIEAGFDAAELRKLGID
jgi:crotonobetainyl-CoA:carnitine CoA-transferase CaiB-like acyl-CoA transferase